MKRTLIFIVSVFLLALTASSCGGADASSTAPSPYSAYEIDPLFWTYFKKSGGTDLFGPVISTLFTNPAGEKQQFTEAGLLVFSPQENRYYFASLGLDLNLSEPPDDTQAQSGDLVINGYRIHPALVSFYHELGRDLVGAPISNPHYNYAKNRLEQHFENLGIYYLLDDPEKTPHLLAYGMVACTSCQAYPGPIDLRPMEPISDGTFLNFIYSNGVSRDLLGDVLKGPTLLTDGSTEMVFEHMVLSGKDGQISIQPLPQQVGYGAAELYTPIKSQILTFIPVKDNTGHNVLNAFNNFINQNGGYAVIGLPTTELYTPADQPGVIRQCFVHLCLDFYPTALEAPVRPVALGEEYISQYAYKFIDEIPNITADESTTPRSSGLFSIYVWENYSAVNSSTPQTISAMVFSHGVPQPRQILNLYITLPDGSLQLYTMPATNNNGRTGLTILPIAGENGEMIQYQVCLDIQGQESICIKDSYMIWGNP